MIGLPLAFAAKTSATMFFKVCASVMVAGDNAKASFAAQPVVGWFESLNRTVCAADASGAYMPTHSTEPVVSAFQVAQACVAHNTEPTQSAALNSDLRS